MANNTPLTWLIQFVKDKLHLSGWANFVVLFLVQRPAFPIETILAFVGRTASHLHHCRHHSFFLNLPRALVQREHRSETQLSERYMLGRGRRTSQMSKVKWASDALLSTATIDQRTAREGARTHRVRKQSFPM